MTSRLTLTLVAVSAATMTWVGVPVSAAAAPPGTACGSVLTTNTTLFTDLIGCPNDGLVIGADNITLDLNGHTLSGVGGAGSTGVGSAGHSGVTIKDGLIRNFQTGVGLQDASRTQLRNLRLIDNNGAAVLLVRSTDNRISGSNASHLSSDTSGAGILLFQSARNEIERNTLSRNGDGISLIQSNDNEIQRNTSSDSGAGIVLVDQSTRNVVSSNATNNNFDTGVLLDNHVDSNRIEHNSASGNGFAGIAVGASDRNQVRRNVTDRNLGAGITVVDGALGTLVDRNEANANGFAPPGCVPDCPLLNDGIHIDAPQTTVTRNAANRNADLGIEAVPGVIDGGRNSAVGNVNPMQCLGIICRPAPDTERFG